MRPLATLDDFLLLRDRRRVSHSDHQAASSVMVKLFLDCEWADANGSELVSLALVSEDGAARFYAEVNPLPANPTDFVRFVVFPLLEHGYFAMQKTDITEGLRSFLERFREPFVLYDNAADGALFRFALEGFDLPARLGPLPAVNQTLVLCDDVAALIERYFREHPAAAARRHHALVDAEALRWACTEGAAAVDGGT